MEASKVVEQATVQTIKTVAQDIVEVHLQCPQIASRVLAGQCVSIEPGIPSANCRRPFTVYFREDDIIRLVFQIVGPNTRAYADWKVGQEVEILGPIGQGITINQAIGCFLMITGGCGLASMYFPAWEISEQTSAKVIVGAGFRNREQVFGLADFQKIGITLDYVTEAEDGKNAVDLLLEILNGEDGLPSPDKMQIITCGPKRMMQQVATIAQQADISCLAFIEEVMGCGGNDICKSCGVPLKPQGFSYVCKTGPVFPTEEVDWDELIKRS